MHSTYNISIIKHICNNINTGICIAPTAFYITNLTKAASHPRSTVTTGNPGAIFSVGTYTQVIRHSISERHWSRAVSLCVSARLSTAFHLNLPILLFVVRRMYTYLCRYIYVHLYTVLIKCTASIFFVF